MIDRETADQADTEEGVGGTTGDTFLCMMESRYSFKSGEVQLYLSEPLIFSYSLLGSVIRFPVAPT